MVGGWDWIAEYLFNCKLQVQRVMGIPAGQCDCHSPAQNFEYQTILTSTRPSSSVAGPSYSGRNLCNLLSPVLPCSRCHSSQLDVIAFARGHHMAAKWMNASVLWDYHRHECLGPGSHSSSWGSLVVRQSYIISSLQRLALGWGGWSRLVFRCIAGKQAFRNTLVDARSPFIQTMFFFFTSFGMDVARIDTILSRISIAVPWGYGSQSVREFQPFKS